MANAFDRFVGAAGSLASHTADSSDTWPVGATLIHLTGVGAGAVYMGTGTNPDGTLCSWTPPSADYSAEIVIGADWITGSGAGPYQGIVLRSSGADGSKTQYYMLMHGLAPGQACFTGKAISGGAGIVIGVEHTFPRNLIAGDVLRFAVSGTGATVTLSVYFNGTLLFTNADTDSNRIVSTGSAGIFLIGDTTGFGDQIRAFWAGALAGPTNTITPSAPTVVFSATQGFSAAVVETNETINWTCSAGSCAPTTGATTTWTAPSSGSSATITWTSADLPDHTATATVALISGAAATAFTLTGPSSGFNHNASTVFTFTPNNLYTGTITPTLTGLAGVWSPTSLTWSASAVAKTATFTPSAIGSGTANGTASPALTQPASVAYTSTPQTLAVTPGALPASSTTPETFTGGGTFWLTSAPTFTPTGVAGVSIGTVTVDSNTQARANITTGTATGTITWTDSTTGATVTELVALIANVLSIGEGFATGLSTVGFAVYDMAGASITGWSAVGVTERGSSSGDYGAVVPIPQDGADYEIRWSQTSGTTPPFVHDIRRAAAPATGGTGGGPTAAQIASAVWQDATAGDFTITGSIGKYIMTGVTINLAQSGFTPRNLGTVADAALTVGDALLAAICAAAGKETVVGTTYTIKSPSTGSVIRTFTLDSASSPSSRN
jgi:hypothetical protein